MSKTVTITGRGIILPDDNIDTDRIIPSRFLKCVTFDNLGGDVLADDRAALRKGGQIHPFDDPRYRGATILITGANFGSGSSREHAVHALTKWNKDESGGIKAIIAKGKYSEIFFGNAMANGLVCLMVGARDWLDLTEMVEHDPQQKITINFDKMAVSLGQKTWALEFQQPAAREALLSGSWDNLTTLLEAKDAVDARLTTLPYLS
ncbi:MAG: hypothetical protein A2445_05550 [Candidatus Jacksonbacteria bacterium RIFOXYC2_FULL_44_29]|nr:MAG: 3-isopropylmalate dehydratase, small subunit [Parcubacteria group bacterium GW2011_GWC2_44_22]OGY76271.1 MAG: hypothetical protein A2240_01485 [Candidatus Jacksonbacteria bacterium RIFOXYA2_FULL_43_12]OGY79473.1 MAG: hypothetical protein A2550_04170 [Candidatus Jacksonbacteria bacterium RIFOXYD2_FULL_43_21]OGY80996.1 MAG: hypothetical protein A2445_05550 [Candidatus Jacksonbacteria bacterium RIFOXYC2_FULL_44_29]